MQSKIAKSTDHTITLTITVPSTELKKTREEVVQELAKQVSIPGFRKGKAPKKIALEQINEEKIKEEVLKKILPQAYAEALRTHNLNPIVNPRIHIEVFEQDKDLIFIAQTCEEPEVDLQSYKDEIKKLNLKSKIIIPGKDSESKKPTLDETISALLAHTKVIIPKVLIEQETERLLSQFLDELKTLGLSLEQYLSSRGKTGEQLRAEYNQKAERDIKLEFLLRRIANEEKITVEQEDLDEVIKKTQDEQQKKSLEQNKYFLSALIRQQKTLDFLTKI